MTNNQDANGIKTLEIQQDYAASMADAQARLEHQVQLAQSALKGLMIVNGGAIIALFTFLGTGRGKIQISYVWWGFSFFVGGLVLTLLATILGFLAQGMYMNVSFREARRNQDLIAGRDLMPHDKSEFWGNVFEYAAIFAVVLSLAAFACGAGFSITGVIR